MKLIFTAMKSTFTEALESKLNFAPRMAMNGRIAMNGSCKTLKTQKTVVVPKQI